MSATHLKAERLDCRIAVEDKRLLERAASKTGQRLTDFVVSTLLVAGREVLREDDPIRLSRADWDRFLAALDEETTPSPRLTKAMARFARGRFEDGRYYE